MTINVLLLENLYYVSSMFFTKEIKNTLSKYYNQDVCHKRENKKETFEIHLQESLN